MISLICNFELTDAKNISINKMYIIFSYVHSIVMAEVISN